MWKYLKSIFCWIDSDVITYKDDDIIYYAHRHTY